MTMPLSLPKATAIDRNGEPMMGAQLWFYASGTSTPLDTWTDEARTTANANPVTADSFGVFPPIWLSDTLYRVTLTDAGGTTQWTVDGVGAPPAPIWADTAGGGSNDLILSPATAVASYVAGLQLTFIAAATNTGPMTVAVSGLAAVPLTKNGSTALGAGDIPSGSVVTIVYDGTRFQIEPLVLGGYTEADFAKLNFANYYAAAQVEKATTLTYGPTVTVGSPAATNYCVVTATNGTGFTISNPSFTDATITGHRLELTIRNTSGGALGAITWGDLYKMSAWTSPANGYSRSIAFRCNGTNWVQVSQTGVDVPN